MLTDGATYEILKDGPTYLINYDTHIKGNFKFLNAVKMKKSTSFVLWLRLKIWPFFNSHCCLTLKAAVRFH